MSGEWTAVLVSLAYVGAVVGVGEGLRKWAGLPVPVTRKVVHIGAGLWIIPTLLLFHDWRWAVIPPLAAVPMNYLSVRRRLFRAMETDEPSLGTVYFPVSLAVCLALFWPQPAAVAAGIMAMTWGDPAAAWAGQRWGWGSFGRKTLAGSLGMFLASLAALAATLTAFGAPLRWVLPAAVVLAAAAALLEAPVRHGTDNLLVPIGVSALAFWLLGDLAAGAGTVTVDRLALGTGISLAIAAVAYRRGALAATGVLGAVLTGTLCFGFGGWVAGVTLVAFFVSSSVLSRVGTDRKAAAADRYAKGHWRDLGQVLANGGVAAGLALAAWLTGGGALLVAAVGALAAACADTWATEVGGLSQRPPRLMTTLRPVPAGTSGAVSGPGLAAAVLGALAMAAVAVAVGALAGTADAGPTAAGSPLRVAAAIALGGLAGSLADSLLGATVQGIFRCAVCGGDTERRLHHGQPAALVRGRPWLGNDLVNLACTLVGAAVAYGLVR